MVYVTRNPTTHLTLKVTLPTEPSGRTRVYNLELGHQKHTFLPYPTEAPFYVEENIDASMPEVEDMPEVKDLLAAMLALTDALVAGA